MRVMASLFQTALSLTNFINYPVYLQSPKHENIALTSEVPILSPYLSVKRLLLYSLHSTADCYLQNNLLHLHLHTI